MQNRPSIDLAIAPTVREGNLLIKAIKGDRRPGVLGMMSVRFQRRNNGQVCSLPCLEGRGEASYSRDYPPLPPMSGKLSYKEKERSAGAYLLKQCIYPCLCYLMIIVNGASRYANGSNNFTFVIFNRNSAGKRNESIIGMLDIIKASSGL